MKRILLFFLFFLASCSSSQPNLGAYSIGRDSSWFPLRLNQYAVNINGFTNALVQELAKVEKKDFRLFDVSWNQLFEGLEKGDFAGIFTSLPQNVITTEKYTFSNPFLLLGPVLVVPASSKVQSLADLEGLTVGAYQYDESVLIIQQYPSIVIDLYPSITQALEDLANGKINGALIPNLDARALIPNLYSNQLKIVTAPLSNKGLRLITQAGKHKELIKHFNEGLEKLRQNGTYREIRHQFKVP